MSAVSYEKVLNRWVAERFDIDETGIAEVTLWQHGWVGCPTCGDVGIDLEVYVKRSDGRFASRTITDYDIGAVTRELVRIAAEMSKGDE